MSPRRWTVKLTLLLSFCLVTLPPPGILAGPESTEGTPGAGGRPTKPMSLEAWRRLQQEAEDAMSTSDPAEKIARCEAFLRDHPDYPDSSRLSMLLVSEYVESGNYDPRHVADLIEKEVARSEQTFSPLFWLNGTYCKYQLPKESATRLIQVTRERLERDRRALAREKDPKARADREMRLGRDESNLLMAEGRLLLFQGDVEGAVVKLRESDEKSISWGADILATDAEGRIVGRYPTFRGDGVRLHLAEACARAGDPKAARECLAKVTMFFTSDDESAQSLRALRTELKMDAPAALEVNAEPTRAADFTLKDLEGRRVRLSDYRGKVVLLNFWTTW